MSIPFSGTDFAQAKLARVAVWSEKWRAEHGRRPTIVSVFPYEDRASAIYTNLKKKDALAAGINYVAEPLSLHENRKVWIAKVLAAAGDPKVDGILVQKPGMAQYCELTGESPEKFQSWWASIAESIPVSKDLDGLAPTALFNLERSAEMVVEGKHPREGSLRRWILAATAQAVIDIALSACQNDIELIRQKTVSIIGRSVIVGRPAAAGLRILGVSTQLLSSKDNLSEKLPTADIIISATGQSGLIASDWIKEGSILIDVGAPTAEFQSGCYDRASFWTPVPRGVGPVTRACLLENLEKVLKVGPSRVNSTNVLPF